MLKNRFSIHCIEVTKYFYFNSTEFQPKIKGIFLSNAVDFMELRYLGFFLPQIVPLMKDDKS